MAGVYDYLPSWLLPSGTGSGAQRGYYYGSQFPAANVNTPYTPGQTEQDAQATAIRTVGGISGTDLWQATGDAFERPNVSYTPGKDYTVLAIVVAAIFITIWLFD